MPSFMEDLDRRLEEIAHRFQRRMEWGRLAVERTSLRRHRDGVASKVGLLAWRQARGDSIDQERFESLCAKLDEVEEKLVKVERDIASARGETVSVDEEPAPPAQEADAVVEEEPA